MRYNNNMSFDSKGKQAETEADIFEDIPIERLHTIFSIMIDLLFSLPTKDNANRETKKAWVQKS